MARTRKALPAKVDIAHLISAGVLASVCPRGLIEEVLADTGKASQRERLLPAPAVVYYVMALALWREAPLEEVLRVVCEGLQWLGGGEAGAVQASKSAISQARTRLGAQVMRELAERVLRPLADPGAPGAWYRGLRIMALDGSCMDVADEAANAEHFGYPGASRGQSAFPQARVLGLVECGTHAVTAAAVAPYGHSEQAMAAQLLPAKLKPDMLVLADRNFYGFKLWRIACASGAKLAWRVKSNLKLPVQRTLPDGSFLSAVFDSADRQRCAGQIVRVIDYTLHDSAPPVQDSYRLITTILDPEQAPALELAALYHERWEIEGVFDEFKTHLRANSTVLRSKTPELVQQELWGLLLAHFAIRQLMAKAAWPRGLDPDRLSFTHAVRVIKRKMPQAAAVPP
ncbi:MAG: IS4 family transposase [Rhodanobacteraceae bacterium]|nr:IS4 family transposase [Rhodanobacteraceae bacterium]